MTAKLRTESGFSLIELLVATGLLLIVSSIATSALLQMTTSQKTIWNRTEMHSGIRGATELLQQEVGQAGRISVPGVSAFPGVIKLTQAVSAPGGASPAAAAVCDPGLPLQDAATVTVNTVAGIFASLVPVRSVELMTTMDGNNTETVVIAAIATSPATIRACFQNPHASGTVLQPMGGFATGIIPNTGFPNGSSATVLKLYGDINADGNMVYVEYTCDINAGKLYRNMMAFDAVSKPAVSDAQILLSNIIANPGGTPCFNYQTATMTAQGGTPFTFVLDVAVTLTVQTEQIDPLTKQKQTETKALLNVTPRNVFNTWSLGNIGYTDRIQSTPTSVTNLLP